MPSSTAARLLLISASEMSDPATSVVLLSQPNPHHHFFNNLSIFPQAHTEISRFTETGIELLKLLRRYLLTSVSFASCPDDLISPRHSSYGKKKNPQHFLNCFDMRYNFFPTQYISDTMYWSTMILPVPLGIKHKCVSTVFEKCPEIAWMKISRVLERASVKSTLLST